MSLGDLQIFLEAANRLEARERLARIGDLRVAMGGSKKGQNQRERRVRQLERLAFGGMRERAQSGGLSLGDLQAAGIGIGPGVKRG